jgi:starch-binding outer membrane protein, SusD/RagB family
MKRKINYLIILFLIIFTACNYLDFDESSGQPKDWYYEYFGNLKSLVNFGYVNMYQDFGKIDGAMLDCGTDDAEYTYSNAHVQALNNGSWSAFKTVDPRWDVSYKAIRHMNDFLETYDFAKLERFQYNQSYEDNMREARKWPFEARILRAYHLFELAKRYGDIPMPLSALEVDEANTIEKTPFNDVISFIVTECNSVMDSLPERWDAPGFNGETGRFTKGAVMALKSRALLYAASPLHNPENDRNKWIQAAQAAHDIIVSGMYTLEPISKNIFNTIEANSRELILTIRNPQSNDFERNNFPIGFEGGSSGTTPTQNLVDAFQTKNGDDVTLSPNGWVSDDPDFNPQSPYANRDPRFYNTVLYDNAQWKGRSVEVFRNGLDAPPIDGATKTGYYLKKYVVENVDLSPSVNSTAHHHWIVFRYADILFSYAEAMNEAYGPEDAGSFTVNALNALNQVRTRASMPAYSGLSQAEFREALRRERRVELAFEGHRFWDVRRWKIGNNTQTTIQGVDIEKAGENRVYTFKTIENRVWNERMNLFPIPQQEIYINPDLEQNPGW